MRTRICDLFGIEFPIFAFSHCRDVVAAVSRAGGFGVLGALAFSPEQLEVELAWIDAHVGGRPYGVDVVMPAKYEGSGSGPVDKAVLERMIGDKHRKFVADLLDRHQVPPLPEGETVESLLGWTAEGGRSHVDVSLTHPIKLLVNALGPPPPDVIAKAHEHGVKVAALVGKVDQARKQVAAGVDIIVAQGHEAGGHTGEVTTMVLVPEVVDAVSPVPVLAAGGIGCGRQAAAALALGADGVWTGSIWLTVKEADSPPAVVDKLLRASSTDTVRSRCLSGKPARQLKTTWTEAWEGKDSPGFLPMPLQYMLTADASSRIYRHCHVEGSGAQKLVGSAVGQIVGRMNQVRSTQDVIHALVGECLDTIEKLGGLTDQPAASARSGSGSE
jgi:NAD(P)H-dependent flavin oxidoreductase YrpB (nitropropane dioxygenase family)